MTSRDLITAYIQSLELRARKGAISNQTKFTYTQGIKAYVKTVGVAAPISTETYVSFLKRFDSVSPSSIRTYKSGVLDFYSFCHAEFGTEIDLLALREATRRYTERPGNSIPTVNIEAIENVIRYAESLTSSLLDLRNRAFIVTVADTGFRAFEICKLKIGDINWTDGTTMIIGKRKKKALVRFSPRALQYIREYLDARKELDSHYDNADSLPLFARHDKSASTHVLPVGTGGMWAAIKDVATAGGIDSEKVWIHALRHYYVTCILKKTGNLKLAQELARHSNIQVTQRYAHLSDSDLDAGYNQVFG